MAKMQMMHPDGTSVSYRDCFEAPPGWLMTSADFSGQELNVMAAMSGCPIMIGALNNGEDLHGIAGSGAFNVPLDKVREKLPGKDKSARDYGKVINFSLAYGKTAEGFAKDWKISKAEAKKVVENYERKFPVLTNWLKRHGSLGIHQSFSRLSNGAMRHVGQAKRADKDAPKRAASNYQIQGLSCWMSRSAMIRLDKRIQSEKLNIQLIAMIHDELLCLIKSGDRCAYGNWCKHHEGSKEEHMEACKAGCPDEDCALRYETVIGDCMGAAGYEFLKGIVPAGYEVSTATYWKH